jgi:hypothetical protein
LAPAPVRTIPLYLPRRLTASKRCPAHTFRIKS